MHTLYYIHTVVPVINGHLHCPYIAARCPLITRSVNPDDGKSQRRRRSGNKDNLFAASPFTNYDCFVMICFHENFFQVKNYQDS